MHFRRKPREHVAADDHGEDAEDGEDGE